MKKSKLVIWYVVLIVGLCGCATSPPKNADNICNIFKQYPKWYFAAQKSQARWGIPISIMMAIIRQESSFIATAKPSRQKLLGIIPWFRPSSAFGYSQALDGTWSWYKKSMRSYSANRDSFSEAVDFVGWYCDKAHYKAGIAKGDSYNLYLAYCEGIGGYTRGTYKSKKWLMEIAKDKVERNAWVYHRQLQGCLSSLPKR
jgi:hypothetical protein